MNIDSCMTQHALLIVILGLGYKAKYDAISNMFSAKLTQRVSEWGSVVEECQNLKVKADESRGMIRLGDNFQKSILRLSELWKLFLNTSCNVDHVSSELFFEGARV